MKRIKNLYKTGFIGMIALGLTFGASAQRHGGGGGGRESGGGGRSSGRMDQPRQSSPMGGERSGGRMDQPRQSSPMGGGRSGGRMDQPRQSSPMGGGERHEVTRGQRDQQSFPRNNQPGNTRSESPRSMPQAAQTQRRDQPRQNFPAQQQPAGRQRFESPVARNGNRDFRPGGNGQGNNFRPVSSNNRSFGGRGYDAHFRDRAWGYGYNHYSRSPISINRFYYSGAYHPHPYYYRPFIAPRWGIHISVLPYGYYPFYFGSYRFFYNDGLFYQPFGDYYETVEPPLGAYIPGIPSAAVPVIINGGNYYEYNGTYYQRVYSGSQPYEVVGVNGLLQNDLAPATPDEEDALADPGLMPNDNNNNNNAPATPAPEELSALPENFKTVTLNNITYYVSPSGEYYTKNIDENGKVTYTVAAIDNGGQ